MKKLIFIYAFFLLTNLTSYCEENLTSDYMNSIQNRRAVIYNVLNLTDEQRNEHEKLTKEYDPIYEEKIRQLARYTCEYEAIKNAKIGFFESCSQRHKINSTKHDIKRLINSETKKLEKKLSRSQKSKLSMIKHLEHMDSIRKTENKDYKKNNPQMPYFGNICE